MAARRLIGLTVAQNLLLTCLATTALGDPPSRLLDGQRRVIGPRISQELPPQVAAKLQAGFELALQRLGEVPECGALFTELGADGTEELSATFYLPAELKMELRLCRRAHGYSMVGAAPAWLCRNFASLQDRRAAVVLLHEGLHHAGLDERPNDPGGLAPRAIDQMVETACDL